MQETRGAAGTEGFGERSRVHIHTRTHMHIDMYVHTRAHLDSHMYMIG